MTNCTNCVYKRSLAELLRIIEEVAISIDIELAIRRTERLRRT